MPARRAAAAFASLLSLVLCASAHADSVADFYRGKVIKLIISTGEGGGYGTYANTIIPYMQRYIPGNPKIIVQHMQGAGGLVAANYMANVALRDGTMFAMIHRAAVSTTALFGMANVRFDPSKFGWIGSMNDEKSICAVWHTAPAKTFDDLRRMPITMGGLGAGGDTDVYTNFLNNVFGTKMKLVTGYDSGGTMDLAIERGELQGRCAWSWSTIVSTKAEWFADKKIVPLVQLSMTKHPDHPDVPAVTEFATSDEQRQLLEIVVSPSVMGRPLLAPPDIPADRLAALRTAFESSMKDPKFLADAATANLEISMVTGVEIEGILKRLFAMPRPIIDEAARSVEPKAE
jgi:tripartite-type tricarboxylate transporter receptor subunit TctC